jgi:hypothetical protein
MEAKNGDPRMQIERPEHLSEEGFLRWLRGLELVRMLHQRRALTVATLEVVEPEHVSVYEFRADGDGLLVCAAYDSEDVTDAYVLAVQLSLPPGTRFEVLVDLVRTLDRASVLVTDLVIDKNGCHSMIRSSPVSLTILETTQL